MTFDPTSVEVTCVTLPKDHCVQVPWEYINVCGYSDQFCKNYHIHTYTYCIHILHTHTTYRISDHIVSQARQQKEKRKKKRERAGGRERERERERGRRRDRQTKRKGGGENKTKITKKKIKTLICCNLLSKL